LEKAIAVMDFPALSWQDTVKTLQEPTGVLVSFEGRFRTKNGPKSRDASHPIDMTNLETAPHIYARESGTKFVLPYDPRFLTTNTAVAEMSAGQIRVGGFGIIKRKSAGEVCATPLFIGLRASPEGRALMQALATPTR
jgi:hypothetical protein